MKFCKLKFSREKHRIFYLSVWEKKDWKSNNNNQIVPHLWRNEAASAWFFSNKWFYKGPSLSSPLAFHFSTPHSRWLFHSLPRSGFFYHATDMTFISCIDEKCFLFSRICIVFLFLFFPQPFSLLLGRPYISLSFLSAHVFIFEHTNLQNKPGEMLHEKPRWSGSPAHRYCWRWVRGVSDERPIPVAPFHSENVQNNVKL